MRRTTFSLLSILAISCGGGSSTDPSGASTSTSGGTGGSSNADASVGNAGGSSSAGAGGATGAGGGSGGSTGTGGTAGTSGTGGSGGAVVVDAGSPCDLPVAYEAFGVMVGPAVASEAGADADVACGAKARPCTTVQQGIDAAAKAGKQYVYVAAGTYNEDGVTLTKGVSLIGGWNAADWTRACPIDAAATIIRNVAGSVVVTAKDLGGSAGIESITLKSKAQSAVTGDGESLYGLFAKGATTQVSLSNVKIELANAGRGANGDPGADPGDPGAAGTCPATPSPPGQPGANGSDGAGATAPMFTPDGFKANNGADATAGQKGGNGAITKQPTSSTHCGACDGTDAASCEPASGGPSHYYSASSEPGKIGCGGSGGGGGKGGHGGGSSVAIFVSAAKVDIVSSALAAGNGGAGGDGVSGKAGGAGVAGVAGAAKYCASSCCWGSILTCLAVVPTVEPSVDLSQGGAAGAPGLKAGEVPPAMVAQAATAIATSINPTSINPALVGISTCRISTSSTLAGGEASAGALGGTGGKGGGGSGGSSFAIVKIDGGTVMQKMVTLAHGTKGAAGAGANAGAVGAEGDSFE